MINPDMRGLKYKRILLKCSGEALMGNASFGIDPMVLEKIAGDVSVLHSMKVQLGLVIGGGNLFRGSTLSAAGVGRVTGDHMGMLATVMNALALRDALERASVPVKIMSAIPIQGMVHAYDISTAITYLSSGFVVIFSAGTGNPFFTTDTAACLRAIEVGAEVVLKATKVDGVYSKDPAKYPDAVRYSSLTYQKILDDNLAVMDATAICLCREHKMPLQIFDMAANQALIKIIRGEIIGTIVGCQGVKL